MPDAPATTQAPALAAAPKLNLPGAVSHPRQAQAPYQQAPPSPYQAPASSLGGPQAYGGHGGGASPNSIHLFAQTKPWVTMFAVLSSIGPLTTLLLGLFIAFAGASGGVLVEGMAAGLLMAAIGAIYFLPAWRLWQYSSAIGNLRLSPTLQAFDHAIDRQRCFWKTVGVITLIGFGLSVVIAILAFNAPSTGMNDYESIIE